MDQETKDYIDIKTDIAELKAKISTVQLTVALGTSLGWGNPSQQNNVVTLAKMKESLAAKEKELDVMTSAFWTKDR